VALNTPDPIVPRLLDELQAAIDAQKARSLAGDEEGMRRAGATVSRILSQLETRKDALASESVHRLLEIRDAHRAVCLAIAGQRQEVQQRLRRLALGKSAAAAYSPHRAGL